MQRGRAIIMALLMAVLLGAATGAVLHAEPVEGTQVGTAPHPSLLPFLAKPGSQGTSPERDYLTLTYTIDRSQLPALYYQALTLHIYVGPVTSLTVTATALDGSAVPVTYSYDEAEETVTVTTTATQLKLLLEDPQDPENAGHFEKAALKGGARWAWSHSFDDNMYFLSAVDVLRSYGYRGTLYLIANLINDTGEEDWIVHAPALKRLLGEGWSIGNHTWEHTCDTAKIDRQTIISGYNRLSEIVAGSPVPEYRVTSFAAPCFRSEYHVLIQEMVDEGTTDVQFNESGARDLLVVDPAASDYYDGGKWARAFTYTIPVGRDPTLGVAGGLTEAVENVDWMAAYAAPDRHFWYNTFTHRNNEAELDALAAHIYDNYGAGGSGEAWIAPADEIYSYLLVRDRTTVSFSSVD